MNSGTWNRDEKDLLDQSLMENGKATSYEHIMSIVTTRKRSSIVSYYRKNKEDLLRRRKENLSRKEKNRMVQETENQKAKIWLLKKLE